MSRRRPRKAQSCQGKMAHATRDAATNHMHSLIRQGASVLRVYKCRFCKKFHVGHPPREPK